MQHPSYAQTQWMWGLWIILPASLVGAAAAIASADPHAMRTAIAILVAVDVVVLALFGRLQIQLDNRTLEWRFGWLPWPRWQLPLDRIVRVEVAESRWHEGWGIRFTSQGMLYNAHGFGAVRLQLVDGRNLRLGSAEPARLADFLRARLPTPGRR